MNPLRVVRLGNTSLLKIETKVIALHAEQCSGSTCGVRHIVD